MKPGSKRQFPLEVLKALERIHKIDKGKFIVLEPDDAFLLVKDPASKSDFYFKIEEAEVKSPTWQERIRYDIGMAKMVTFKCSRMPTDKYNANATTIDSIVTRDLIIILEDWMKLVTSYEKINILSDPILEQYEEEFYKDFNLVDEDADTHSFPTKTQKLIDIYTEKVAERLEDYKLTSQIDGEKRKAVESIISDVNQLRDKQTTMTKNQVVKSLASIFAKCKKAGLKVLEEVKSEVIKEVVKLSVKGLLDHPNSYIDFLTDIAS